MHARSSGSMLLVEGVNGLTLPEPYHTSALPSAIISISFRAGIQLIRCCAGNATESDRYRSALAAAEAVPKQVRLEVLARCRILVFEQASRTFRCSCSSTTSLSRPKMARKYQSLTLALRRPFSKWMKDLSKMLMQQYKLLLRPLLKDHGQKLQLQ